MLKRLLKRFGYVPRTDYVSIEAAVTVAQCRYQRGLREGFDAGVEQGMAQKAVYVDPYLAAQAVQDYFARQRGDVSLH